MQSKIYFILIFSLLSKNIVKGNCGDENVLSRNECFAKSIDSQLCCYNAISSKCQAISKENLTKNLELDCGIIDENYEKYEFGEYHPLQKFDIGLQSCGTFNPKNKEECTDYSELTNSCCLFKNNTLNACFYIGRKFNSNLKDKNTFKMKFNITEESIVYECYSFNIILGLCSFIYLILLL